MNIASPLVNFFGGPSSLRQAIQTEIVERLQGVPTDAKYFSYSRNRASDEQIRAMRATGKRRMRIYNYERDAAIHFWCDYVYVADESTSTPLLKFDNGAKVLTINTQHHPILVKVLQSVVAHQWPEVKINLAEWGHKCGYRWTPRQQELPALEFYRTYNQLYSVSYCEPTDLNSSNIIPDPRRIDI